MEESASDTGSCSDLSQAKKKKSFFNFRKKKEKVTIGGCEISAMLTVMSHSQTDGDDSDGDESDRFVSDGGESLCSISSQPCNRCSQARTKLTGTFGQG